jgi:hypothetical protein
VPWENGCDNHHHEYRQWTVNLALWFTHILAGNNHRLDWGYNRLCEEKFAESGRRKKSQRGRQRVGPGSAERRPPESERSTTRKRKNTQKQTESQETLNPALFSFSENPIPQPNVNPYFASLSLGAKSLTFLDFFRSLCRGF